jgi:nitrate reductase NapD
MPDEVHISSLIVHVRADCRQAARASIAARDGIEIHGEDAEGRMVVVLETPSEAEILAHVAAINDIPGIVATSLIYHEIDRPDREEANDA